MGVGGEGRGWGWVGCWGCTRCYGQARQLLRILLNAHVHRCVWWFSNISSLIFVVCPLVWLLLVIRSVVFFSFLFVNIRSISCPPPPRHTQCSMSQDKFSTTGKSLYTNFHLAGADRLFTAGDDTLVSRSALRRQSVFARVKSAYSGFPGEDKMPETWSTEGKRERSK